jgi:hypothetical protein
VFIDALATEQALLALRSKRQQKTEFVIGTTLSDGRPSSRRVSGIWHRSPKQRGGSLSTSPSDFVALAIYLTAEMVLVASSKMV